MRAKQKIVQGQGPSNIYLGIFVCSFGNLRKLRLSGIITSDPFEILHAEKELQESLYISYTVYAQQMEASFIYDDLPILSRNYRQCSKVLNYFASYKTPGNDGNANRILSSFLELGWRTFSGIFQ